MIITEIDNRPFIAFHPAPDYVGRYHKGERDPRNANEHFTKALEIFEWLRTLIEPDKVGKELA